MAECERQCNKLGRLINHGPDKKYKTDEIGEENAAAIALQDDRRRVRQRLELSMGAEYERQS